MNTLTIEKKLNICILLRGINAFPFILFISTLNIFLEHTGLPLNLAAEETNVFFSMYYLISVFSAYLIQKGINADLFYLTTNYIRSASLALLFFQFNHTMTLLFLSLFLACMAVQQIVILEKINTFTQEKDYKRRKTMVLAYASINIASLATYFFSFLLNHFNHINIIFILYAFFPYLSNYLYKRYLSFTSTTTKKTKHDFFIIICGIALAFGICSIFLTILAVAKSILSLTLFFVFIFFIIKKTKTNKALQNNLKVLLFLIYYITSILYFSIFFLNTTFVLDLIQLVEQLRSPQLLMIFDPISAIVFFLIIAWLIKKLKQSPLNYYTSPILFSLGFIVIIVAFSFLQAIYNTQHQILYIIFYISLLTVGELLIAPDGFALPGRLLNKKHQTLGVGLWRTFLGASFLLSNLINDNILSKYSLNNLPTALDSTKYILLLLIPIFLIITGFLEHKVKYRTDHQK